MNKRKTKMIGGILCVIVGLHTGFTTGYIFRNASPAAKACVGIGSVAVSVILGECTKMVINRIVDEREHTKTIFNTKEEIGS